MLTTRIIMNLLCFILLVASIPVMVFASMIIIAMKISGKQKPRD